MPHTQTVNALRVHFRNWVMNDVLPPDSVYPTLNGKKADAGKTRGKNVPTWSRPTSRRWASRRFRSRAAPTTPEPGFINPVLDYDWGPLFNYTDASGIPTNAPPPIKQVINMLVPRTDADGNEVGGVPVVLTDAPLGTYVGWNVTADGARPFHKGQLCDYVGGMIPFAKTRAERVASRRPAPVARGALRHARRLRAGGVEGGRQCGRDGLPAAGRCRCPDCRCRCQQRAEVIER